MRKLFLSALFVAMGTVLFAQNMSKLNDKIKSQKFEEARTEIDAMLGDAKNQSNSDVWFAKAKVYHALGKSSGDSATNAAALEALTKYFELESKKDESKRAVSSMLENHQTAIDIYSGFFNAGVKSFQASKWPSAHYNFVQALNTFDILAKNNITSAKFDTTATLYGGYAAQNAGNDAEAVRLYTQIADLQIPDSNYIVTYEYLVTHYQKNNDETNRTKYLEMGKKLFPSYNWLRFDLARLSDDKKERIAQMEKMVAANPGNKDLKMDLVVELFNYTYGQDKVADYTARQEQLTKLLQEVVAADPSNAFSNYIMAQHISNQIYDVQQAYAAIKGTKPEDVKKKQELNKDIEKRYDELFPYAEAAYKAFEAMPEMKPAEKANFKMVANQLVDYYTMKKQADKAKFYQDKVKAMK